MADEAVANVRIVHRPGIKVGRSMSAWFAFPPDSEGHVEYEARVGEVDDAERAAYQTAQTVIVR